MTDTGRSNLDDRPTADEMLARVRAESGTGRGRLRVYLGMAPGVGKTFRMLEEAHRRVERGTDLVVGFVEAARSPTDGRAARGARDHPAAPRRVPRRRSRGDGHRCGHRPPARGGSRRRARPHQRARLAAREAVAGRPADPRRRHRRRQHAQRPAPRIGRRCGRHDHRSARSTNGFRTTCSMRPRRSSWST